MVTAFWEVFWSLMVTWKMNSRAQDCFPRPLVQRPIHNFTATSDTPSQTRPRVLPRIG